MTEDANAGYYNYIYHDSRNMNVITDYYPLQLNEIAV